MACATCNAAPPHPIVPAGLPALRLAPVRVLATIAGARRAATAGVAAPARSCRPVRGILATAGAFGTRADGACATFRLNSHEKLLFCVDVMSTMKGVSHSGRQSGLDGTAIVVEQTGYLAGRSLVRSGSFHSTGGSRTVDGPHCPSVLDRTDVLVEVATSGLSWAGRRSRRAAGPYRSL
jgi:hypothetical protein